MTRKRFVKLLMAKGIQRNDANEIAKDWLATFGSYITGRCSLYCGVHGVHITSDGVKKPIYICADLAHIDEDFCWSNYIYVMDRFNKFNGIIF